MHAVVSVRVLIVDDHRLFAEALRAILDVRDRDRGGRAGHHRQPRPYGRPAELAPDVVLMDISMPDVDGLEATRRILAERPGTQILIVTGSDARQDVDAARIGRRRRLRHEGPDRRGAVGAILDVAGRSRYPEAVLQVVAVLQVLLSIGLIGLILMHSGRDTGFGGMGFTPASQGGTHIVERNLTRLTCARRARLRGHDGRAVPPPEVDGAAEPSAAIARAGARRTRATDPGPSQRR